MINKTSITFKNLISIQRTQYSVLAVLAAGILACTGILNYWDSSIFQRFIGGIHPVIAILSSIVLGFLLLSIQRSKGWFAIYKEENLAKVLRISALVGLFASTAILIDLQVPFSADINIPFPKSLLFYPVIAFFVEIVFHVLPLTVLLFLGSSVFKLTIDEKVIWGCIFLVAIFEPTYQVRFMAEFPLWAIVVTWLNLFLFNVMQLQIFKNYDFIAMYSFRLMYYLIWHILWGYIRLEMLF